MVVVSNSLLGTQNSNLEMPELAMRTEAMRLDEILEVKILSTEKKDFPQVTSGIIVPSVLNDPSFFDHSIHQNEPIVNTISPIVNIQSRNIYK